MPPLRKYSKEEIIHISYEIVRKEGFNSLNARRIASELKSSVQPIFHNFTSMEEVRKAVLEKSYQTYHSYMQKITDKHPYKQLGLSYITFAKDESELFKILFMNETNNTPEAFIMSDSMGEDIIKKGQELTGFSYEKQKSFHVKVWIFTHGIACLVATKTVKLSNEQIEELFTNTVLEMFEGYKERNK